MQGRGRQGQSSTAALARVSGGRLDALRLSRRAKRGDRGAFEEIFRRHHQELYRYCLAILSDRDDAEDALQATMAAALRSLPGEAREVDIRPWLFRVAHNESVSILRRRRVTDEAGEDLADGAAISQEAELATRERLRGLVADLGELPDRQRSAIVMRELSGLSYGEIGSALTCSEGAARQAVYEARTALREREEGRAMECEHVRRAISDRDGRRLRGRRIKAHLAGCDGCRGFAAAISQRRSDLRALFPPLPAAAAGAMLSGLAGGGAAVGGGAAGAGAAAAGGGIAASAAVKGASLAAAVAIAAGAADIGGLVDLPSPVGGKSQPSSVADGASAAPATGSTGNAGEASGTSEPRSDGGGAHSGARPGSGADEGRSGGSGHGNTGQADPGRGDPGNGTAPLTPSAPASGGNGGGSSTAPGQTGASPGGGTSTAPGQTGSAGNSATAPGHTGTAGNSASAPGQTGTAGNSASAPGQNGTTSAATGTAGANGNSGGNGNSSK